MVEVAVQNEVQVVLNVHFPVCLQMGLLSLVPIWRIQSLLKTKMRKKRNIKKVNGKRLSGEQ